MDVVMNDLEIAGRSLVLGGIVVVYGWYVAGFGCS